MDLDHWRKINEDDDEFLLTISPSLFPGSLESRPCYTSILTGDAYVKEILEGHEVRFKREFRMEPRIFQALANCLRERFFLHNLKRIAVEEQLAMFVYTLAHNASNRDVQEHFQHSAETVSGYFGKVLNAITTLAGTYIEPPSTITSPVIQNNSKFFPYFKDCISAIDGTHIPITISLELQDPYRNRKQTLLQNVMVACDFNSRFIYVRAGWERSASDARILQHSIDQGFHVPRGKYYLVDAGYANTPNFIAPYRGVRYHLQEQGQAQCRPCNHKELFNLKHASLRNHVERIIAILKMRFPILKVATFHPIDYQTDIVVAACVLHNFILTHNGAEDIEEIRVGTEEIIIPDGDNTYGDDVGTMKSERNAGAQKRDEITMQM